jgi:hypothetical protein
MMNPDGDICGNVGTSGGKCVETTDINIIITLIEKKERIAEQWVGKSE